jgi:hypothetical protein
MVTTSANIEVPIIGRDRSIQLQRKSALGNSVRALGLRLGDVRIRRSDLEALLPRVQKGHRDEVGFWMWVCMSRGL